MKAPKDREDFTFQEKSEKDFEIEDMMETLQASGMGGGMGALIPVSPWSPVCLFFCCCFAV